MLKHEWFNMEDDYNVKMNEMEFKLYELKDQTNLMNNYSVDLDYLAEQKTILMGQNQGHRNPAGTF